MGEGRNKVSHFLQVCLALVDSWCGSEWYLVSSATTCPAPNYKTAFLSPVFTSQRAEVAFFVMWWHMDCSVSFLTRIWIGCDLVIERLASQQALGVRLQHKTKQMTFSPQNPSRQQHNVVTVYYNTVKLLLFLFIFWLH